MLRVPATRPWDPRRGRPRVIAETRHATLRNAATHGAARCGAPLFARMICDIHATRALNMRGWALGTRADACVMATLGSSRDGDKETRAINRWRLAPLSKSGRARDNAILGRRQNNFENNAKIFRRGHDLFPGARKT